MRDEKDKKGSLSFPGTYEISNEVRDYHKVHDVRGSK